MERKRKKEVDRRDFLKVAAAATAGAAAFGVPRPGYVAEGGPITVGVVGCGGRGRNAAENALQAAQSLGVEMQIVALGDAFEDRVKGTQRALAKQKGGQVADSMCFWGVDNFQKVLQQEMTYVILATPPGFRPEHFDAAVNAKRHIFCEKPVATDPVGMRRFMAAAKRSEEMKLSVTAGTQRRHENCYIETVKKLRDGAIGKIVAARAYWCGGLPWVHDRRPGMSDLEYQLRNWYAFCWICGDNIVEQHVHNLDIINWVMGKHPVNALASGGRAWKPRGEERYGDIWDSFSVDYDYGDDVRMYSFSRHWNNSAGGVFEEVFGTEKKSSCRDMGEGSGGYVNEHRDLILSIMNQGPYFNEAMQVAESTFTAILGREAAYSGKRLGWDELLNSDLELVPKGMTLDMKLPVGPIPVPGAPNWGRGA